MLINQVGSPNWAWEKLGYTIKRIEKLNGKIVRYIYDTAGNLISSGGSYEDEVEKLAELGMVLDIKYLDLCKKEVIYLQSKEI